MNPLTPTYMKSIPAAACGKRFEPQEIGNTACNYSAKNLWVNITAQEARWPAAT